MLVWIFFFFLIIFIFVKSFYMVFLYILVLVCGLTHCQRISLSCSKSLGKRISFCIADSNISIIGILWWIKFFLLCNSFFIFFNIRINMVEIIKWLIISLAYNHYFIIQIISLLWIIITCLFHYICPLWNILIIKSLWILTLAILITQF